jgi:RND family efflux transporter MFP subunit
MTRTTQPPRRLALKLFLLVTFSSSAAAALLGAAGCTATATPARVPPPASVTVVASKKMTVPIIATPIGTTRALEEVTIRARVKGFLEKPHFQYGTNVKKGDLLLEIDDEPFKVQVDQAKAQLEGATASLEKAQLSKSVEISTANLAIDQAQFRLDEVEERRERILLARKAASQEDYDRAEAQKRKSAAKVEGDQASLEQSKTDYKIDIATAQADVDKAQAALADAKINLSYCKMFAPINGRIGELKVKAGNLVGDAGPTELVTIQQLDPMGLDLRPPARYLPNATALLPTGVAVALVVEGERRHPHVGKAIFIDNRVDEQTSSFLLRAQVDNPLGTVLPGEYIKATMTVGQYVDAVVVPEQAVLEGQEGTRVFVVDSSNKVGVAKVRGVDTYRGLRVLESGLEAGRKVIVEGVQLVRQGQTVKSVAAPLEQFMSEEVAPLPGDLRFNSRVSRVPGRDSPRSTDELEKAGTQKAEPAATKPETPQKTPAESETKPHGPGASPAGKQPR